MFADRHRSTSESPETREIREGLGAAPVGNPAVVRVFPNAAGSWCVTQDGVPGQREFPDRQSARLWARVAVARCRSYRLLVASDSGWYADEYFNWPTPHPLAAA